MLLICSDSYPTNQSIRKYQAINKHFAKEGPITLIVTVYLRMTLIDSYI